MRTDVTKSCFKCHATKPLADFYRHGRMADGHLNKCKECTKADTRANYAENVDQYREYERTRATLDHRVEARKAYAATDRGRDAARRGSRAFAQRNPIKYAAKNACSNAIRDGRLIRQPCEVCGKEKAQAHHDDYSKPLEVRWLCTKHHAAWHRENTPLCPDQSQAA